MSRRQNMRTAIFAPHKRNQSLEIGLIELVLQPLSPTFLYPHIHIL